MCVCACVHACIEEGVLIMIKEGKKCVIQIHMVYELSSQVITGELALCPRSLPVLKWRRSWRAPWTSLRCAAAMATPTPTSVPCVSRDSKYTQLLHPHSIHTWGHIKSTLWRLKSPSRPPVVKQQSVNRSWFKWLAAFQFSLLFMSWSGNEQGIISQC